MNLTRIRWTDLTWGFASGCEDAGPECRFCYARSVAESGYFAKAFPNGFGLTLREHKLSEPVSLRRPSLIFPGSMTDIGLEELPVAYFAKVVEVMRATPRHRYQCLTKRPREVARRLHQLGVGMPANVWMGATIGHKSGLGRLHDLFTIPGPGLYWLSVEPLLEDLAEELGRALANEAQRLRWMVVGGESGSHASYPARMRLAAKRGGLASVKVDEPWFSWWCAQRDLKPENIQEITTPGPTVLRNLAADIEGRFLVTRARGAWAPAAEREAWVRRLRDLCEARDIAFFFKQWGGPKPDSAGHQLYGRAHEDFPLEGLPVGWSPHRSLPVVAQAS